MDCWKRVRVRSCHRLVARAATTTTTTRWRTVTHPPDYKTEVESPQVDRVGWEYRANIRSCLPGLLRPMRCSEKGFIFDRAAITTVNGSAVTADNRRRNSPRRAVTIRTLAYGRARNRNRRVISWEVGSGWEQVWQANLGPGREAAPAAWEPRALCLISAFVRGSNRWKPRLRRASA